MESNEHFPTKPRWCKMITLRAISSPCSSRYQFLREAAPSCVWSPQLCRRKLIDFPIIRIYSTQYKQGPTNNIILLTFCASSLLMKEGSMLGLRLYLDLHNFSSLEESSQEMKNSRDLSMSSPSNIQQFRMELMGWYTCRSQLLNVINYSEIACRDLDSLVLNKFLKRNIHCTRTSFFLMRPGSRLGSITQICTRCMAVRANCLHY